ncbi:MAG: DUF4115 domain-containing protein [Syntrophobacteraceae bacterium]|nr:DUF4115 domain-containing protein [Syntrophobacteraceae bacterium]
MTDGPKLKMERLRLGWTLQDASERTRINITVLGALESGETSGLFSPFAVDALIAKYSKALGMTEGPGDEPPLEPQRPARGKSPLLYMASGLALGAIFSAVFIGVVLPRGLHCERPSIGHHLKPLAPPAQKPVPPPLATTGAKSSGVEPLRVKTPKEEKKAVIASPEAAVSGPAVSSKATAPPPVKLPAAPALVANKPAPAPLPQPKAVASQPAAIVSGKPSKQKPSRHFLDVAANRRTWVEAIIDGAKTESQLFLPGQTRRWTAEKKVYLIVGNCGGVSIMWDGVPVAIKGKPGRVVRLRLSGS